MSAYLSVIVALIGLIGYLYFTRTPPSPPRPKFVEIFRLAYAIGLLAFLLTAGNAVFAIIAIKGALSLGVCLLGFVVYLLAKSDPWAELSRLAYAIGGLAFLITWGAQVVSALSK